MVNGQRSDRGILEMEQTNQNQSSSTARPTDADSTRSGFPGSTTEAADLKLFSRRHTTTNVDVSPTSRRHTAITADVSPTSRIHTTTTADVSPTSRRHTTTTAAVTPTSRRHTTTTVYMSPTSRRHTDFTADVTSCNSGYSAHATNQTSTSKEYDFYTADQISNNSVNTIYTTDSTPVRDRKRTHSTTSRYGSHATDPIPTGGGYAARTTDWKLARGRYEADLRSTSSRYSQRYKYDFPDDMPQQLAPGTPQTTAQTFATSPRNREHSQSATSNGNDINLYDSNLKNSRRYKTLPIQNGQSRQSYSYRGLDAEWASRTNYKETPDFNRGEDENSTSLNATNGGNPYYSLPQN